VSELRIGWKEWVALPDLQIPALKAKVDTGARTSTLHATRIEPFTRSAGRWVRFVVQPLRRRPRLQIPCEAPLIDVRDIKDSGGHVESRFVIETTLVLGPARWPVTLSLTDRGDMLFRMLIGRTALAGRAAIFPAEKYLTGKAALKKCYPKP
jgi:hypothetical protein